jgi:Uma2 family endonuclease
MEKLYTHNQVKGEVGRVLGALVAEGALGRFLPDGMLLRNTPVGLSTEPDGTFVSYAALQSGRVRKVESHEGDCTILEGAPEMVLEVVSDSSAQKDTVELRDLYWQAGIDEYWLVDARGDEPHFELLRRAARGYVATRRLAGGWLRSNVFGRLFLLTREADPLGDPLFRLQMRPLP